MSEEKITQTAENPEAKKEYLDLKDTVELMLSDKMEDRMKAEYLQLSIRINKLSNFLWKIRTEKIPPIDKESMKEKATQLKHMRIYRKALAKQAPKLGLKLKTSFVKEKKRE